MALTGSSLARNSARYSVGVFSDEDEDETEELVDEETLAEDSDFAAGPQPASSKEKATNGNKTIFLFMIYAPQCVSLIMRSLFLICNLFRLIINKKEG